MTFDWLYVYVVMLALYKRKKKELKSQFLYSFRQATHKKRKKIVSFYHHKKSILVSLAAVHVYLPAACKRTHTDLIVFYHYHHHTTSIMTRRRRKWKGEERQRERERRKTKKERDREKKKVVSALSSIWDHSTSEYSITKKKSQISRISKNKTNQRIKNNGNSNSIDA